MALAIALMGAGFTGQAIAVAFDRRYGALKRIGAAGVPTWVLIAGKVLAVGVVVCLQILVLTVVAIILGWHGSAVGLPIGLLFVVVGVAAFTSLGLLLGGTLSSEMTLALANTLWFVLLGAAAFVTMVPDLSGLPRTLLGLFPSVALTDGLRDAGHGSFNTFACGVLALSLIHI